MDFRFPIVNDDPPTQQTAAIYEAWNSGLLKSTVETLRGAWKQKPPQRKQSPIGILELDLIGANHLPASDYDVRGFTSDPYCVVRRTFLLELRRLCFILSDPMTLRIKPIACVFVVVLFLLLLLLLLLGTRNDYAHVR